MRFIAKLVGDIYRNYDLDETNTLANNADTAQMNFAMGYSDNTHDLIIAQQKASLSLQYTVAIKNQLLASYKEIMNMQISELITMQKKNIKQKLKSKLNNQLQK